MSQTNGKPKAGKDASSSIYVDYMYLSDDEYNDLLETQGNVEIDANLKELLAKVESLYKSRNLIYFENANVVFQKDAFLLMPIWDKFPFPNTGGKLTLAANWNPDLPILLPGSDLRQKLPTADDINITSDYIQKGSWMYDNFKTSDGVWVNIRKGRRLPDEPNSGEAFPVIDVSKIATTPRNFFARLVLEHNLVPEGISEEDKKLLVSLSQKIKNLNTKDGSQFGDGDNILEQLKQMGLLGVTSVNLPQEECESRLLKSDWIRARVDEYNEDLLTDTNRGHWELWPVEDVNVPKVRLAKRLRARNPCKEYQDNGVIAIDFGTKSTVVAFQNGSEQKVLMRIGCDSRESISDHYQNPTIMHLKNFNKFMKAYNSEIGRPHTIWEDLPVSHQARANFSVSKSDEYYAYLTHIKQWAGDNSESYEIKPEDCINDTIRLHKYTELEDGEFDPIEIYAYYIGLYINNMLFNHGIFLTYYLSMPVTYKPEVRKKLSESFRRGLRKSLPAPVLKDLDARGKDVQVIDSIKEPEAYAACALKKYEFNPVDDELVLYGIFDFGGGTTDFNFGIWSDVEPDKRRYYDYKLQRLDSHGDEHLGGETLLEQLAYEIFKDNLDALSAENITFWMPPYYNQRIFAGGERVVDNSQVARRNIYALMQELRKYWEQEPDAAIELHDGIEMRDFEKYLAQVKEENPLLNPEDIEPQFNDLLESFYAPEDQPENYAVELAGKIDNILEQAYQKINQPYRKNKDDDITIYVNLYDRHKNAKPKFAITTTKSRIEKFIHDRIEVGVRKFFDKFVELWKIYDDLPDKLYILLAGNSCKSPVVKEIFNELIPEYKAKCAECKEDREIEFEIYPPLGTPEAFEMLRQLDGEFDENDLFEPTGKTGVAFGLLECRAGGRILLPPVTSSEMPPFKYYLGIIYRKRFHPFEEMPKPGVPEYNEWYHWHHFDKGTTPIFEIHYTSSSSCQDGKLKENDKEVHLINCDLGQVDENADVYIRAVEPDTIEYVVASDPENVDGTMLSKPVRRVLNG